MRRLLLATLATLTLAALPSPVSARTRVSINVNIGSPDVAYPVYPVYPVYSPSRYHDVRYDRYAYRPVHYVPRRVIVVERAYRPARYDRDDRYGRHDRYDRDYRYSRYDRYDRDYGDHRHDRDCRH